MCFKYILHNPLKMMFMSIFGGVIPLHSESLAILNCSNTTDDTFFDMLEKNLAIHKIYRPVKNFHDILNVSIDITLVGILGVVSLRDINKSGNLVPYLSF